MTGAWQGSLLALDAWGKTMEITLHCFSHWWERFVISALVLPTPCCHFLFHFENILASEDVLWAIWYQIVTASLVTWKWKFADLSKNWFVCCSFTQACLCEYKRVYAREKWITHYKNAILNALCASKFFAWAQVQTSIHKGLSATKLSHLHSYRMDFWI